MRRIMWTTDLDLERRRLASIPPILTCSEETASLRKTIPNVTMATSLTVDNT